MKPLHLHENGKDCLIDLDCIMAIRPPLKGKGSLVMLSSEYSIHVDESVAEIKEIIEDVEMVVEVDLQAND